MFVPQPLLQRRLGGMRSRAQALLRGLSQRGYPVCCLRFACGAAFRACNREHGVKMGFSHRLRRAGNAARGFAHELGLSSKYVFVKRIKSFSQINT